jgi:hypothetical protein
MNAAEELVFELCRQSFLRLWSYANPRGKKGKELCDALVVFDPDVVIFSVKEIALRDGGNPGIDRERWIRAAVHESHAQIWGAERWIGTAARVVRADGGEGLPFPPRDARRIHRVAVALGSGGVIGVESRDYGHGFVHVLDDVSLSLIMREMDTVRDFVGYLRAKEELYASAREVRVPAGEEDLLAVYLHRGRSFRDLPERISIQQGAWDELHRKPEFRRRKLADRASYAWDSLIDFLAGEVEGDGLEFGTLGEMESLLRVMAGEDRFARRMLGRAFRAFLDAAAAEEVQSRTTVSPSGVRYVFLAHPHGGDREWRLMELQGRCFVARSLEPKCETVIGIATDRPRRGAGFSMDALRLTIEEWTEEHQRQAEDGQRQFGWFANPSMRTEPEDEYPGSS